MRQAGERGVMRKSPRQSFGAEQQSASALQIIRKVTPGMIIAGECAYTDWRDGDQRSVSDLVLMVYGAMEARRLDEGSAVPPAQRLVERLCEQPSKVSPSKGSIRKRSDRGR